MGTVSADVKGPKGRAFDPFIFHSQSCFNGKVEKKHGQRESDEINLHKMSKLHVGI